MIHQQNRHLVDSIMVPHRAVSVALKRINQCLDAADGLMEPICIPLIGESGTGKTRILESISANYQSVRQESGLYVPLIRITAPSLPTIKGLYETLLLALGDPIPWKGTISNMDKRLLLLMKTIGTKVVMLDEFHHFENKKENTVLNTLKNILNNSGVILIVSGLPVCMAVLSKSKEMQRRSESPIVMPKFDWQLEDDREEFFAILQSFHQRLSAYYELPELHSDEMAFRFYCATGGLIGYLTKILRKATWDAIDENRSVITLDDLDQSYRNVVIAQNYFNGKSPFKHGFTTQATNDTLMSAKEIGVPEIEQSTWTRQTYMKPSSSSAASVLRT